MSIGKVRKVLYFISKVLGDINAVKRGKVKQRIYNKAIGKVTSKLFK
ncbi:hypothetical protein JOC75_003995 [Metabacillus crassostreae]|nr:hypothetical protein [Metabacillus crassostreae]MBM7605967.1 hypothetical protein [Metabacillus crassostreae]